MSFNGSNIVNLLFILIIIVIFLVILFWVLDRFLVIDGGILLYANATEDENNDKLSDQVSDFCDELIVTQNQTNATDQSNATSQIICKVK